MKVLITGACGMLGTDLTETFKDTAEVLGIDIRSEEYVHVPLIRGDLTDKDFARDSICGEKPDLIFHAAAMTQVDLCEKDRDTAQRLNVDMTKNVVAAANRSKSTLVFFSTDYIFDGTKNGEWTEEDCPHPLNFYGETKKNAEIYIQGAAERYVIFRVSWLFGFFGQSFPRTIMEKARTTEVFEVVCDQVGRPTYTRDVALALKSIFLDPRRDAAAVQRQIFHLANNGYVSWADFAEYILTHTDGRKPPVRKIQTPAGHRPAMRPKFSVLSLAKAERQLGIRMRPWQDAVEDFIAEYEMRMKPCV